MDPNAWAEMFARFGMTGLAAWVQQMVVTHGDQAGYMISGQVYDQDEYKAAFPAMAALRAQGRTITEVEYRATEQTYRDSLAFYGLANSAYDSPPIYQKLMENGIAPRELEARLDDARAVSQATDPNVRRALQDYYGINANDLMIYALDPKNVGKDHVEKLARSAVVAGVAETTRLGLTRNYAESIAMDSALDNKTEADVREMFSVAADVKGSQERLAAIEGSKFSGEDAVDVAVKKDAQKILQSRNRAKREAARFGASSGTNSGSLAGAGI